ncbi:MAG: undecaprenyl-diphosphate phosphatase [Bdellovibrionia bacterium]
MDLLQSIILGIIEGITEFLPISSTGHLIIASNYMGISDQAFTKAFEVIIQSGAILAVLILYWKKFCSNLLFYKKLFVAFIPTVIIGLLVKDIVDQVLGSVLVVAWSLIIGGVILIWSDKKFAPLQTAGKSIDDLSFKELLLIGLAQTVAFIPGVSRSGATIIGGLSLGMNKKEAAEFSFFLAVPTMAAATAYKLLKILKDIEPSQIQLLAVGWVVSLIVAIIAIKAFIGIVSRYGFKYFGIYRILVGAIILLLVQQGSLK